MCKEENKIGGNRKLSDDRDYKARMNIKIMLKGDILSIERLIDLT